MRYASLRSMDITNGEGIGVALFVQGCHAHCYKCFNPETWDFNGGKEWTVTVKNKLMECLEKPYISRFSILGGEPLAEENIEEVTSLVQEVRQKFPEKKIWLWSGKNFECDIMSLPITQNIDYVIDGLYIEALRDLNLHWRGSRNQHIWWNIERSGTWKDITEQTEKNQNISVI